MRNSWTKTLRRLAVATVVAGSSMFYSAMCYANAFDVATDPTYADGWQAGDNGGTGFTPWNFDNDLDTVGTNTIDDSSPFNNLGTAWRIAVDPDITRAGRGFSPLAVGQTIRLVIDNPTEEQFFKGYIIRLNTGGGNICFGGAACTPGTSPKERLGVYTFEYDTFGNWLVSDSAGGAQPTTLFDVDTAAAGVQIDVTLTGPESYRLVMDPLGSAATYTHSGNLGNAGTGSIDWLEFVFFNVPTDPSAATDFYIKSIEIIGSAPPSVPGDYNGDNTVNAADFTIWRDRLGQTFTLTNEKPNPTTPGVVDQEDYDFWKTNFGNGPGSGGAGGVVPEPSTLVFVLVAVVSSCITSVRHLWGFGWRECRRPLGFLVR